MGIQRDLNVIHKCRKSLLHLTMLTSIVAAAAAFSNVASAQESKDGPPMLSQRGTPPAIPYCDSEVNSERTIGRRLVYITTLDGRLTALDASRGGKLRWSIPTGPGPLISSSIHRLELTNNGQFVRMIPSLSGGIYKFDGESIDPIPITTENLLSSSAKFSDDLVVSGGKETRTYGVSARTGQLLYECSMHGCVNITDAANASRATDFNSEPLNADNDGNKLYEHDPLLDDVIVVRRQTQTVRAVESRSGVERWNFSVGQHELNLIKSSECHDLDFSDIELAMLDLDFKVIVPEGTIYAYSKTEPNSILWKYKFDHPIVSGWRISADDDLESIDMFSSAQWLWDQEDTSYPHITPSIYLGMYDKQLYIQESVNLRKEIVDQSSLYTHLQSDSHMPVIPWRPIPASTNQIELLINSNGQSTTHNPFEEVTIQGNELVPYEDNHFALSAQSVLNGSEYVNGNGFFLFTREDLEGDREALCGPDEDDLEEGSTSDDNADKTGNISNKNNTTNRNTIDDLGFSLDDIDAPVKVVILSLWFWWKEVLVIAVTSAVLLNLFLGQRQRHEVLVIERHVPVPTAIEATEQSTVALLGPTNSSSKSTNSLTLNGHRSLSESTSCSGEHFSSRFQGDFDLVRCLGRGGFGVVFEAKNKLDDCKYAVKRITLPNKKESRDRVMREVKTLANCEHQNIVRYFQAWVETPPPGWQEEEDSKWLTHEMCTSIQVETPDGTTMPSYENGLHKRHIQVERKKQLLSWVSSVASTACSSDHESSNCINEEEEEEEDDDSFIVFRSESQSMALREEEDELEENDNFASTEVSKQCVSKCKKLVSAKDNHSNSNSYSNSNSIAIDIHSNSFDLGLHQNGKNIDYSALSDSFQIEFVRSANGDDSGLAEAAGDVWTEKDCEESQDKKSKSSSKRKRRSTSSDSSNEHNNNNCKALLPVQALMQSPPKPQQNKVYLYIQMQLCRKESLRDWLRDNKCSDRQNHIANIFHQIVDAVDYVHLKGLIHRDLKPSNIFFSQEGQIKIGDFGLVTDMSDIPNMVTKCGDNSGLPSCSRHTQQVGTHLYMSPEQLRGQHYDFKVDIYSLGLIFFELLVYFCTEMERIKTLRDLRDGRYPPKFFEEYPKEYDLLKLMLSQRPEERPATPDLKLKLIDILKLPDFIVGDGDTAAVVAAVRRLSRSRTLSSSE